VIRASGVRQINTNKLTQVQQSKMIEDKDEHQAIHA